MAHLAHGSAYGVVQVKPELLFLLEDLPLAKQLEVLDFARFLSQQAKDAASQPSPRGYVDLRLAPASSLLPLTGVVALGGDALADTEALYDDDHSGSR